MITQNVTPQAVHRNVKYKNRLQNFNPGLTLIGLSETGPRWIHDLLSVLLIMWIFQGFSNSSLPRTLVW